MEVGRSWVCRCYPAPTRSCTLALLRTDTGGDAGQKLRCPQCLHAGVRDEKQGPSCGPSAQPAPGTADPISRSGPLTWGTAGNAPAPLREGLCSVMEMTSQGTGSSLCQRPLYPSTGDAAEEQHLSLQLSSTTWPQFPGKLLGVHRYLSFRQNYRHG